jgi:soluble P-type ATPase
MIRLEIPLRGTFELHHAVFDINGTLSIDGVPIPNVAERLKELATYLSLHALSAGTHGNVTELEQMLGIPIRIVTSGEEKAQYVQQLDPTHVIAFGNGMNDIGMLQVAKIGVAILGAEGMAVSALQSADVIALGPIDALDLVLRPKRLVATLRG